MKVALVYFLEGVLLSVDAKKNISEFYLSMVDDLAMFNAYPWGSEVYDLTFDSCRRKTSLQSTRKGLQSAGEASPGCEGDLHSLRLPVFVSG